MKALEGRGEIRAAAKQWKAIFTDGAEEIGTMNRQPVLWHAHLGIWGMFGSTHGRGGIERAWNAFGQKPFAPRSNMIVEINPAPGQKDLNIQGVFARDDDGSRWILHQGRLSVPGGKITEDEFIEATGLEPTTVEFNGGSTGEYHKVAPIDVDPASSQQQIATFIAQCARAKLIKKAPADVLAQLGQVQDWERKLNPETSGTFEYAARKGGLGERRHGAVWQALCARLESLGVKHSNERVGQYGPDLFTFGSPEPVLFEIKSAPGAHDVFAAVGQLHLYERLLGAAYRKVLVIPKGMANALRGPVAAINIETIEYERKGRSIAFDDQALCRVVQR